MSTRAQTESFAPPAVVGDWQRRALFVGAVFAVASIIGLIIDVEQFFRAYLLGFLYVLGLGLGSLAVLMIYHATGGAWGTVLRRMLEAASRTLWAVAIAFVPIIIGIHHLYPWSHAEESAHNEHLQRIGPLYLNPGLFIVRAVVYFALWIGLAWWLNRQSERQDREAVVLDRPFRGVGCVGLVIYGFSLTFAAMDWAMSLDPEWFSTIWGLLFMAGHGLITWSMAVIVLSRLVLRPPMREVVEPEQFHDYGKLLLACTMLWGWFTLSQWLIIWSGNLPEEISWYLNRTRGGWREVAYFVVIGQFFIPFFLLLSRSLKRDHKRLMKVAAWIMFMRYWDLYWYVMPNFENRQGHFRYSWLDAVVPIALVALWFALFFSYLRRRPLLAVYDDHVKLLLEQGHEIEHERA
ncbi:MAG: hypothetical protein ACE14L_03745 [Terriglobales bacterium]